MGLAVDSFSPVVWPPPLMSHSNDQDCINFHGIDQAKRKSVEQHSPQSTLNRLPDGWMREADQPHAGRRPENPRPEWAMQLRKSRMLRSSLLRQEEEIDSQSFEACSGSGHYLVAWLSFDLAFQIGLMATLGFIDPELLNVSIEGLIQLFD